MDSVIYEIEDHIAYVTINRPEAYNACDQPTYDRLAEVWADFARNDDAWIAILTGAGDKAFCAGSDIKQNFNSAPQPADNFAPAGRRDLMRGLEIWKPVIAAINGHCNGGGLEQALSCDIRIASHNAQFGLGEVLLGLLPGGGGTQRLPRTIPLGHALWMLYSGERINCYLMEVFVLVIFIILYLNSSYPTYTTKTGVYFFCTKTKRLKKLPFSTFAYSLNHIPANIIISLYGNAAVYIPTILLAFKIMFRWCLWLSKVFYVTTVHSDPHRMLSS